MIRKSSSLSGICRIDQYKEVRGKATHGWQVKIVRNSKQRTKFFSDSKYESKEFALEAAIKYRDNLLKELRTAISSSKFTVSLPKNNTTGILGVNFGEHTERNGNKTEQWQASFPSPKGKHLSRKFSVNKYGEMGALYKAVESRMEGIEKLLNSERYKHSENEITQLIDRYLNILIYIEQIGADEASNLMSVVRDKGILNTRKEDIILGRVGQQSFKSKVLKYWKGKCAVTKSSLMLTAGHIKPWRFSNDRERLDIYNGILLSPLYDKAFDLGYISFTNEGKIIISDAIRNELQNLKITTNDHIDGISAFSIKYLEFHRDKIFIK